MNREGDAMLTPQEVQDLLDETADEIRKMNLGESPKRSIRDLTEMVALHNELYRALRNAKRQAKKAKVEPPAWATRTQASAPFVGLVPSDIAAEAKAWDDHLLNQGRKAYR